MEKANKVQKRAARACSFCRSRKVRCIVAGPSEVCANCKYHKKHCTLDWAAGAYHANPRTSGSECSNDSTLVSTDSGSAQELGRQDNDTAHASSPLAIRVNHLHSEQTSNHQTEAGLGNIPGYTTTAYAVPSVSSTASDLRTGVPPPAFHPSNSLLRTPNLQSILPQDLAFLVSQGCFVVPQRSALDEFMRRYFLHVHPMLPLLNEGDFWRSYNSTDSSDGDEDKLSILVLQGILFSSCGFVSLETLRTLGFKSHQEAKWAFYRRAKLLYDLGCEDSPIRKSQGALLLAQSHLIPRPLAGNTPLGSMWLTIAIHYAREARAPSSSSMMPESSADVKRVRKLRNTLKRLWWCCIICDRVFPLSSRQDIKITRSDLDFRPSPTLTSDDLSDELEHSEVYGPMTKFLLAEVLQKLVELSVVLTDVLAATSVLRNSSNPTYQSTLCISDPDACRAGLKRWYGSWQVLKFSMEGKTSHDPVSAASMTLFTNLLEIYYHSALQALCHSEILGCSVSSSAKLHSQATEKSHELQGAISQVTKCLVDLNKSELIRWLPMTAIGCTAFPLALHLIDEELRRKYTEKEPSPSISTVLVEDKRRHLSVLLDAMNTYKPRYYIADWVVDTVWHIVRLAQQYTSSIAGERGSSGRALASWTELLQAVPGHYLKLVMTLEMSISCGKLPEEADFPPTLRRASQMRITGPVGPNLSFPFPDECRAVEIDTSPEEEDHDHAVQVEEEQTNEAMEDVLNLPLDLDISAAFDLPGLPGDDDLFDELLRGWREDLPRLASGQGTILTGEADTSTISLDV